MSAPFPLESRLREVLAAAQHRYRDQRGYGAIVTPRIPDALLDELAAGLAPLLRELVAEAVTEHTPELPKENPNV